MTASGEGLHVPGHVGLNIPKTPSALVCLLSINGSVGVSRAI